MSWDLYSGGSRMAIRAIKTGVFTGQQRGQCGWSGAERRRTVGHEVSEVIGVKSQKAAWVRVRTLAFALSELGAIGGF